MVSEGPGKGELKGVSRLWLEVLILSEVYLLPSLLAPILKEQSISGSSLFGERAINVLSRLI